MILQILLCTAMLESCGISQDDIDRIVENEITVLEHEEDAEISEQRLKSQGATEEMLVKGYLKSIEKNKNATKGSVDAQKFQTAIYSYSRLANEAELTNLLSVATATLNERNAATLIRNYHSRFPLSIPLIRWCIDREHKQGNSSKFDYEIWKCLEKSLKTPGVTKDVKDKILTCAREQAVTNPQTAMVIDKILCDCDIAYRQSSLRQLVAMKILLIGETGKVESAKRYFESIVNKGCNE